MIAALVRFRKHPQTRTTAAKGRFRLHGAVEERGRGAWLFSVGQCLLLAGALLLAGLSPAAAAVTMQTGDEPAMSIGGGPNLDSTEMRTPERIPEPDPAQGADVLVEPVIPIYAARPPAPPGPPPALYPHPGPGPLPHPGPRPGTTPGAYPTQPPGPHPGPNPGAYPTPPAQPPRVYGPPEGAFHRPPPLGGGGFFFRR